MSANRRHDQENDDGMRAVGLKQTSMRLNIKNPETDRLARELAAATGESITAAVTAAVRERLQRIRDEVDADSDPTPIGVPRPTGPVRGYKEGGR